MPGCYLWGSGALNRTRRRWECRSGLCQRLYLKFEKLQATPLIQEAMVVNVTDISVTRISDDIEVDEDRRHPK